MALIVVTIEVIVSSNICLCQSLVYQRRAFMPLFLSTLFAPIGGNASIINKKWQNPEPAHLRTLSSGETLSF